MEFLALPLILLALGIYFWLVLGGPQRIFAERRRTAEANAEAEIAKLERARLEHR